MRRLRAQLLGASLAAAAAAAAGARPLLLPPGSAAAAAATLTNAFHSWLTPHAVGDAALEPYAVREAALEPPRLAEPAGSDELALEWTGLAGATSYALLASDWWSGADGLSRTVYKGAALAAEVTERVMPGTPTSLQLVASDDSAELARSPAATFSAAESGACGNLADATIWRDNWEHLHDDVAVCLQDCGVTGGTCTSTCVAKRGLPFSARCAACWDQLHDCAVDHCALPCGFSPKGSKCAACTELACTPAVAQCHGIPKWAWAT